MPARFDPAVLETDRLRLRWITDADAPAFYEVYGDPQVARFLSFPHFTEPIQAEKMVARAHAGYADGSAVNFALERRADGKVLGNCMLFRFHDDSRRAEIGYSLARAYWSGGYMREALTALIDYSFGELALNRLEADIDPRNPSSAKILERLGFVKEGVLRERWIVAGEVSDTAYYGLLARDWSRTSLR